VHLSSVDTEASAQMPPTGTKEASMDRLATRKLLAIIMLAAVLGAPLAASAADQAPASTSPLVTPRLVSAIGGGSIKPGAPRPTPSFSLADATGGGPAFPTRPLEPTATRTSMAGPASVSLPSAVLVACAAFCSGAALATAVGRRRRARPQTVVA
jgi:hypothetical protein